MKKGFSLIELMMVIAVIGILTSVGVPAYNRYLDRARMQGLMTFMIPHITTLGEWRDIGGTTPPISGWINIPPEFTNGVSGNLYRFSYLTGDSAEGSIPAGNRRVLFFFIDDEQSFPSYLNNSDFQVQYIYVEGYPGLYIKCVHVGGGSIELCPKDTDAYQEV